MMWLSCFRIGLLLVSLVAANPINAADLSENLAQTAFENVKRDLANSFFKRSSTSCTLENLVVRKNWNHLGPQERISYTDAVLCLHKKEAKTPQSLVPGVRSRYDDFVATHINQTLTIHYTGTFLAWHRWFIWNYEQALRNECGYTGYQPYWNWGEYSSNPQDSPVFDGSCTSMSGNGAYIPNKGGINLVLPPFPVLTLPPGNGGGCVTSGPFKDWVVNLGPVNLPINNGTSLGGGPGTGFAYNPRCLKRDIGGLINQANANASSILNLLTIPQTIADFQTTLEGQPGTSNPIGLHGGGHYTIAGDPGADVFVSPGDPAFYLHHGMIDRMWWIWQNLDINNRRNALSGTGTLMNFPPSPNTTLDDPITLDHTNPEVIKMRYLMSTIDGPFCYVYQ